MRAFAFCLFALPATAQSLPDIPFQTLTLDPAHGSIVISVNHLGFSNYTFGFDDMSATLDFGTDRMQDARLTARIEVPSMDLFAPPPGFRDQLLGPDWFDAASHPAITFTSTAVTLTSDTTATVTGELTLLGSTAPVSFEATFNDGYATAPWEPYARVGFSGTGTLRRSDFGMSNGIPEPGSTIGVGDAVSFRLEAEFVGKPAD